MKIANPLYDHAFKYLMSNDRLARKVLSVILEKEVVELELAQQEVVIEDQERRFTLYRLDFTAVIRDSDGQQEKVLIELQKSKLPTNILRFRNYLGLSYTQKPKAVDAGSGPLPIISIYILGYNIEDIPALAVRVDRRVTDLTQHVELQIGSDFINLLTHTSYVLQVRRLKAGRSSRIEQFMTLFNQAWVAEKKFILDLEEVPEEFKDIAEYLQRPLQEVELREKLQAEEEVEALFALQEAEKEELRHLAEEERRQKVEAQIREEEERRQKEEAQIREEEERRQKEEERRQKEEAQAQARQNALKLARLLRQGGASAAEIAKETGLSTEDVLQLD